MCQLSEMKSKMGILSGKSALKIVLRFAVAVYISACSECWCRLATIFFKIAGTLSLLLQAIRIRDLVKMNSKDFLRIKDSWSLNVTSPQALVFEHSVPRRWRSVEDGGTPLEEVSHWGGQGRFKYSPIPVLCFLSNETEWTLATTIPLLPVVTSLLKKTYPSVTTSQSFVLGYLYQCTLPEHGESN